MSLESGMRMEELIIRAMTNLGGLGRTSDIERECEFILWEEYQETHGPIHRILREMEQARTLRYLANINKYKLLVEGGKEE